MGHKDLALATGDTQAQASAGGSSPTRCVHGSATGAADGGQEGSYAFAKVRVTALFGFACRASNSGDHVLERQAAMFQHHEQVEEQVSRFADDLFVASTTAASATSTPSSPIFCAITRRPCGKAGPLALLRSVTPGAFGDDRLERRQKRQALRRRDLLASKTRRRSNVDKPVRGRTQ